MKHASERAYLTDRLQRAGTSIALNIAEGAGEFPTNEKNRFYCMAKRSATETATLLEISKQSNIIDEAHYRNAIELLIRIVMILTNMAQKSD